MKGNYVPVLVQRENKKELWRIDVTDLSVTELIKLKEELLNEPYKTTIQTIDAMIREETETMITNCNSKNGYIRAHKKNKKEEQQRKKIKSRRKSYDKYKR